MPEEIEVTPVGAVIEESEEIDEIAEQLAAQSLIGDERHAEILQEIQTCKIQLESLSQTERAENPLLTQIAESLSQLRAEMESLKSSMDSRQNPPTPNPSAIESPEEPSQALSTVEAPEEAVPEAPVTPKKKHRFV
jgi:DNA repair ATPase RecN